MSKLLDKDGNEIEPQKFTPNWPIRFDNSPDAKVTTFTSASANYTTGWKYNHRLPDAESKKVVP